MPDTELSLYRNGQGLASLPSLGFSNIIPAYYYGENCSFNLFLSNLSGYQYAPSGSVTFSISLGRTDLGPTMGEWKIGNGSTTGSAVSYNATTSDLASAISSVYGAVNVSTYGTTVASGYVITAATVNTALTINGQSISLYPSSVIDVVNLTTPASGVAAQKLVRLKRNPPLSLVSSSAGTTMTNVSISASGSSSVCSPWYVNIPDDAKKYPYVISFSVDLSGSITMSIPVNGFVLSTASRDLIADNSSGSAGLMSNVINNTKIYNTSSLGGWIKPNTMTTGAVSYYGNTLSDLVQFKTQIYGANGFKITAYPVTSGINTSVTMNSETSGYQASNKKFSVGSIMFSGTDLDQEFLDAKSGRVSLSLEISLTESGSKTILLQTPALVSRSL
jgi:hypothetical protein